MPDVRVASMLASGTEIVVGLGLEDALIAISHECDFPESVLDRPRITRTTIDISATSGQIDDAVQEHMRSGAPLYEIDANALASLRPDVIVTQAQCDVCAINLSDVKQVAAASPQLARTKVVPLNPTSLSGIFDDIRAVGAAVAADDAAERFVRKLEERVERVQEKAASATHRPRTVVIEWIEPLMVAANWMPDLLDIAGANAPLTESGKRSGYTNWDDVRALDPEVIVVSPCGFDLERTLSEIDVLKGLQGWHDVTAVKSGRVFAADGNALFNRSGPRIVDSLELLAQIVHPELFEAGPHADWFRRMDGAAPF